MRFSENSVASILGSNSALARFKFALGLVDHIDAALATHNAAVTVPVLERAERVLDLHGLSPITAAREPAPGLTGVSICGQIKTMKSWWAIQGSNL